MMNRFLVILRYDGEWSPCLLTLNELANKVLTEEQLAGVLDEWVVYRLIPNQDPIRMTVREDFGCGWMSITLYDRFGNMVDSVTVDRP